MWNVIGVVGIFYRIDQDHDQVQDGVGADGGQSHAPSGSVIEMVPAEESIDVGFPGRMVLRNRSVVQHSTAQLEGCRSRNWSVVAGGLAVQWMTISNVFVHCHRQSQSRQSIRETQNLPLWSFIFIITALRILVVALTSLFTGHLGGTPFFTW